MLLTAWFGVCGLAAAAWFPSGPTAAWLTPIVLLAVGAAGVMILRLDSAEAVIVAIYLVVTAGIAIVIGLGLSARLAALG